MCVVQHGDIIGKAVAIVVRRPDGGDIESRDAQPTGGIGGHFSQIQSRIVHRAIGDEGRESKAIAGLRHEEPCIATIEHRQVRLTIPVLIENGEVFHCRVGQADGERRAKENPIRVHLSQRSGRSLRSGNASDARITHV